MNKNKGFTLIELLVVIAIIGILASVVLAALTSARAKGQDAAVQSQIANMRAQAELYYSTTGNNGGYGLGGATPVGTCGTGGTSTSALFASGTINGLFNLADAVKNTAGQANTSCGTDGTAAAQATKWAVASKGVTAGQFYCADSTGVSRSYNATSSPAATALTGASGTGAATAAGTACN